MIQLELTDQPGWRYNERKPMDRLPGTMEHGHTIVEISEEEKAPLELSRPLPGHTPIK